MGKTIFINETAAKMIKESVLRNTLPKDIVSAIAGDATSLGKNPALPNVFEHKFIAKIAEKRFKEIKNQLHKIGTIDEVESENINNALHQLIDHAQKTERPVRKELEKVAFNTVIKLLGVPDDSVDFELNLVDEVDLGESSILLEPDEGDNDFQYEDIVDIESIRDEIYKRRLLDSLSMGAGMRMCENIKIYLSELYDINPKLADVYRKILLLNDYLLFTKEDFELTDKDKKQLGTVTVTIGQPETKPIIRAQGVVLPILICEAIHGCMELFASHGLPKDRKRAEMVVSKADFLKAEPWDMRLGPGLWDLLSKHFNKNEDIPYIYMKIAKLPVNKFNFLFKEIFMNTKKGDSIMKMLLHKAEKEKEYDSFAGDMAKMDTNKSIISDNISPEEL